MQRSWIVTATVIAVAALVGIGAGVTTALVGGSPGPDQAAGSRTPTGGGQTGTDPTGTDQTTPAGSVGTTADATTNALYYADGTIHDRQTKVAYQPRFQSTVTNLARTASGYVVKERFGQDGSRLVLIDAEANTTAVDIQDPHWFSVSPQGTGLAVPDYGDPNVIDFVDTTDGSVISTLTTTTRPGSGIVNAVFTGVADELLILSDDFRAGRSTLALNRADDADGYLTLSTPPGGETSRLIGVDSKGTRVLLEFLLGDKPCVAVLDLTDDARPLWKSCQYRPLGSAGVSPDGARVALAAASAEIGSVTELSVLEADTGQATGAVRISSGFRLIDATWADAGHLVVQGANDAFTAETIDVCSVSEGCQSVPDASPDRPATDVAPGS